MNKLFKKTLALLACMALVGQTMLTSVVTATEELLTNNVETDVEQGALVSDVTDADESMLDMSTTTDLANIGVSTETLKEVDTEEVKNLDGIATTCENTMEEGMAVIESVVNNRIADSKIWNLKASVENNNKLVLTIDDEKNFPALINEITDLIDHLLGYEGDTIRDELNEQWFDFSISAVSQLIDVNLELGSKNIFDLYTTFKGCEFNFQLEIRVDDGSNNGNDDWICGADTMRDGMAILKSVVSAEIAKDETVKDLNLKVSTEDNVLVLTIDNDKSLPSLIGKITELIDHILGYENNTIWDELNEQWFHFDISAVTQLIDVNLELGSRNIFDLRTTFNGCEFDFQLEIRVDDGSNNGNDDWICDADTMRDGMAILESVVNDEITNSKLSGVRTVIENNKLVLVVDNDKSLPSLIGKITELIDYLLGYENNTMWDKLNEQWFDLNISAVTQLIDVNLGLDSKNIFDLRTTFNGCEFNFQLEIRVDDGSNGGNDDWICNADTMRDGMIILESVVNGEIANSKISKVFVEDNKLVFIVDDEKNFPSLLNKITQLIDYLLGYENDTMWDKLGAQWFYFSIDSLTQLINVNLSIGSKRVFDLHTTFNNCRFDFQLEIRVDDGSNSGWNNGNSWYSWWWSSSGGWSNSNSDNSNLNNEELEFGWEVIEPEDTSSKCSIEGSTYSDEENQAYLWACEKWIVSPNNIMKAGLTNPLTRAELDKMMSIYSKQLLGRTYVVNETVSYPDVDSRLGNLAYYIQEWYKLQIMWIHANGVALNNFLPNLLVTRWEFGTVFSRVLYGSKYNIDGANYYEKHLQVLKDAGILTNTNPTLTELRGWVLLMLYRSQKVEESNWTISNEEIAAITAEENVEAIEENTTETEEIE